MRDTLDMAREVKATAYTNRHYPDRTTYTFNPEQLKAFEDLVRADEQKKWQDQTAVEIHEAILDEREACANVCDDKHDTWRWDDEADSASGPRDCAAAIRARSIKEKI